VAVRPSPDIAAAWSALSSSARPPGQWDDPRVPEYLIRTTTNASSWSAIPGGRPLDVLQPRGHGWVSVDGPGDLRLALGGCQMAFSGEDAGWQICFEGDTTGHDTDALVTQLAQQVQEFTGEHVEWIRYD